MEEEKMEGLKTACLYSYGCPELEEMGNGIKKRVLGFIEKPECKNQYFIRDILMKLDPYLYYQLISSESYPAEFFSNNVVRAHWIPDDNWLKPLTPRDVDLFRDEADISDELGKKFWLVQRIRRLGRRRGKPHHNFDVVLQAEEVLQRLNQSEQFSSFWLKVVNNCLIRTGRVKNCDWTVTSDKVSISSALRKPLLDIETFAICREGNKLSIRNSNEVIELGFVDEFQVVGHWVSIHLGLAREILEENEVKRLRLITQEALDFVVESDKN